MSRHLLLSLLLVLAGRTSDASAGYMVYDGGSPNFAVNGSQMSNWIQAADFTLSGPTTFTDIRFWVLGQNWSFQTPFYWQIYTNANGIPGSVLSSGSALSTVATNLGAWPTNTVYSEYQVDISIGSVSLSAGTYWLGLHNGPLSNSVGTVYWVSTPGVGGKQDPTPTTLGGWVNSNKDYAFQLSNTVVATPEPASVALLGIGFAGLIGVRLRRKNVLA